jgi:nucleolar complex protein 2
MARGRTSKATKKFESKHLGRTLETRKIQKRNKDKYNKNKGRNDSQKTAAKEIVKDELAKKTAIVNSKGTVFDGMTMDEFLESGGGGGEDVTMTDEMETSHKAGLEGLKEKDPSFYEFLKQNDKELLEFDPDELIEEDDDDEEMEDGPVEGGLTLETLSKWEKLLFEERSLGTLKKVLIAVRNAAANVTGEEPQNANVKYVLTDPQGIFCVQPCANWSVRSIVDDCIPIHSRSFTTPRSHRGKGWENTIPLTKSQALTSCSSSKITL